MKQFISNRIFFFCFFTVCNFAWYINFYKEYDRLYPFFSRCVNLFIILILQKIWKKFTRNRIFSRTVSNFVYCVEFLQEMRLFFPRNWAVFDFFLPTACNFVHYNKILFTKSYKYFHRIFVVLFFKQYVKLCILLNFYKEFYTVYKECDRFFFLFKFYKEFDRLYLLSSNSM